MRTGEIRERKIGSCGTGRPSPTLVAFCRASCIRHFESVGIMFINWDLLKSLAKKKSICRFVCLDSAWLYDLIKTSISPDFGSKRLRLVAPAESLFTNLSCRRVVHNSSSCPGLRTESAVQMLSLVFRR